MNLDELESEAAKLSEDERAYLATKLLHGLKKPTHDVSDEEVQRRIREAEEDPSVMISFEELVSWPSDEEVIKRDIDMDSGAVRPLSHEEFIALVGRS